MELRWGRRDERVENEDEGKEKRDPRETRELQDAYLKSTVNGLTGNSV